MTLCHLGQLMIKQKELWWYIGIFIPTYPTAKKREILGEHNNNENRWKWCQYFCSLSHNPYYNPLFILNIVKSRRLRSGPICLPLSSDSIIWSFLFKWMQVCIKILSKRHMGKGLVCGGVECFHCKYGCLSSSHQSSCKGKCLCLSNSKLLPFPLISPSSPMLYSAAKQIIHPNLC